VVPVERIELPTFGLQNRCSTAELNRQIRQTRRQIPELPGGGYRHQAGRARRDNRDARLQSCGGINLSLTMPMQAWDQIRDGTGDRAGSRKKKPTVSHPSAFSLNPDEGGRGRPLSSRPHWQICRRPSSPLNQVPGWQTKPLRAAQL
jgi:hypothetical protein